MAIAAKFLSDEEFEVLRQRVIRDTTVTLENVQSVSMKLPKLYAKYNYRYNSQLKILKNINTDMKKTYKKLYHHYKFNGDFRLDSNKEIELYVNGDDEYCELRLLHDKQTVIVDFLEKTLDNLKQMSYMVNQHIEFSKFKKGY